MGGGRGEAPGEDRRSPPSTSTMARVLLTEASPKKRASHPPRARGGGPGALPAGRDRAPERVAARSSRPRCPRARCTTLKRSLTDPDLFAGIGNAYSDEILHRARLSPTQRTDHLDEEVVEAALPGRRRRCWRSGSRGCGKRPARAGRGR